MHLRVLAINVQNTAGDPRRIDLLNNGIRRIAPHLVAFEEVIQSPERKQLEELLQGTGLHGTHQADVMASAPPWADRYGGSAVATRWPHRVAEVIDQRLPDAMDVPWATMAVSVPVPDEGELLFISASTSWRLEAESARERQAVALADLDARHRGPLPTIIAGDFNATPDAASIRYLTGQRSVGGRSVHYHDAWAVAARDRASPGTSTTRTPAPRWTPSSASPTTGAGSTTSSSDPGTPTRTPTATSTLPSSHLTSPSAGSGPATTTASWSTSMSEWNLLPANRGGPAREGQVSFRAVIPSRMRADQLRAMPKAWLPLPAVASQPGGQ